MSCNCGRCSSTSTAALLQGCLAAVAAVLRHRLLPAKWRESLTCCWNSRIPEEEEDDNMHHLLTGKGRCMGLLIKHNTMCGTPYKAHNMQDQLWPQCWYLYLRFSLHLRTRIVRLFREHWSNFDSKNLLMPMTTHAGLSGKWTQWPNDSAISVT